MAIARDLRYAVRSLRRTPAFTLPAVASLALGIAVNTTMFSVVNAVLLRPLGPSGSADLLRIGRSVRDDRSFRSASYDEFLYLRQHASSLDGLLGHQLEPVTMSGPEGPRMVSAEIVTDNYFSVLAVRPALGRGLTPEGKRAAGGDSAAVISHGFWRRQFAGDPAVVGAAVRLNNQPFTIVGVAPRGFGGTFPGVDVDLWLPAEPTAGLAGPRGDGREPTSLMLIGRPKPDAAAGAVQAELDVLARRLAEANPGQNRDRGFVVAPARGVHPLVARVARVFLLLMMAVVAIVLLIASANVASLLLARATARRGELAVRLACGASRGRVIAQLLVESVVLALLGGGLGLMLTAGALRVLNAFSLTTGPTGAPVFFDLQLDFRVLLFTGVVTLATTLVFGLVPAVQATHVDLVSALKGSQSLFGRTRSRVRGALVVVQVALSYVLLVATVLLTKSLHNTGQIDVGFDPDEVVVASFDLQSLGYERPRVDAFYDELLRRARALPGIERAALADFIPMGDRGSSVGLTFQGMTPPAGQEQVALPYNRVSDEYFTTVRQPLVRGRAFTSGDRSGSPLVAIVNEAMARRFWPGEDPIGRHVRLTGEPTDREIVGVAGDARYASFGEGVEPFLYLPAFQRYGPLLALHVRTSAHPSSEALASIRRIARDIDANVAMYNGRTMRQAMAFALVPARIAESVFGVAGAIALLLASGGLYGLVCYTLAQRVKEIGIRVALGATRRRVFRLIVGGAIRLTAVGVAIGLAVAAAATGLLSPLLYGLGPRDPLTFGGIAALLVLVSLLAGYAAARKGLTIDPMGALRHE